METLHKVNYAMSVKCMLLLYSWNIRYRDSMNAAVHSIQAYSNKAYWPVVTTLRGEGMLNDYVTNMKRLEPVMAEYTSRIGGRILKMDHTFKIAKFGRIGGTRDQHCQFYCLLTIMNEFGEILAWWFVSSKSLAMLRTDLNKVAQREDIKLQDIWVDNPDQEGNFLKHTFGENVNVYRDIFHLTKDFFQECRQRSNLRELFMGELSNCIFEVSADDIVKTYDELHLAGKLSVEEIDEKTMRWFKEHKGVCTFIKKPNVIVADLRKLQAKYKNKSDLFKTGMDALFDQTIVALQRGAYGKPDEPIDQHLEACDGTYISTHGSSILESFHLYLQGFLEGYSIGIVSLHFICVDLVYRWNLNRGKKLNRMDCLAIYDPQLLTDVVKLCTNLQVPVPHCFSMWKPFEKQWEGGCPAQNAKEMFGALRAHYHEIWYEEACRYYEKFPEQVSDDDIEFYPHQRGFSSLYEKF